MEYLTQKEIAHAQRQAEAFLSIQNAVVRTVKRTWNGLRRMVVYAQLAQHGDVAELLARAHGLPVHRH